MRVATYSSMVFVLLGGFPASADVAVQFVDPAGEPLTGLTVLAEVRSEAGVPLSRFELPPETEGTSYIVPADPGQIVLFRVFDGELLLGNEHVKLEIGPDPAEPIPVVIRLLGAGNDSCENAQPVAIGSVTADTTVGSTPDGAPTCGTSNTSAGVWFSVVGNGNTLTASTCETVGTPPGSASYDTKISVYCLDCATPTCVGGNDDVAGCNFHSAVSWCSEPGATYRILVHGFNTATGAFNLSVSSGSTACTGTTPCTPPPPSGACCFTIQCPYSQGELPVTCADGATAEDCAAGGGAYQGDESVCLVPVNQIDVVVHPVLPIPSSSPFGVISTLVVPVSAIIDDLNVDIGINHTWISDLVIELTSPAGTVQGLWSHACGPADYINATADDEGTETSCAVIGAGPIDGVYFPPAAAGGGPLWVFDGENALGTWTLHVVDNFAAADLGTLNQWSVHIVEGTPRCETIPCPGPAGGSGCDEDEDDDGSARHVLDRDFEAPATTPVSLDRAP